MEGGGVAAPPFWLPPQATNAREQITNNENAAIRFISRPLFRVVAGRSAVTSLPFGYLTILDFDCQLVWDERRYKQFCYILYPMTWLSKFGAFVLFTALVCAAQD